MAHERNDVTAASASPAVPKLLFEVDGKPVRSTANRTWAATLDDPGGKLDVAASYFAFDANGTGALDIGVFKCGVNGHGEPPGRDSSAI